MKDPEFDTAYCEARRLAFRQSVARLQHARKQGKTFGRPRMVVDRVKVRQLRAAGYSLPAIAREMNLALTTVARICKQAA
jgi:DNA invertase Pin-like site-specific DNA recombinase